MSTDISTPFRVRSLTTLKIQLAIPLVRVSDGIKPVIQLHPTKQCVTFHQTPVIFCSTLHLTQSSNVRIYTRVTNKRHLKATGRIHNTGTSLFIDSPLSIPSANVSVVTKTRAIESHRILPVTEHCINAHRIQRLRTQPPVLRYISMRYSFQHDGGSRHIRITFLLMRRSRCYSVPVVRRHTEKKKNDKSW